jgi:hypothetical protein
MTNKRLLAAFLLAASPAVAGVLEVPVEAARSPLGAVAAGSAAVGLSPAASLATPAAPPLAFPAPAPIPAPGVAAARFPASAPDAAAAERAAAPAPGAADAMPAASVVDAAAAPTVAPAADASERGAFASARADRAAPRVSSLDALFDGRAASAASAEAAPRTPGTAAPARAPAGRARLLRRTLVAGVPLVVAAAGMAAPHAALLGARALGQAAYWLANPLAFLFTVPQIHRMLARRSGEISASMTVVGLLSALATTLCFGFDGKDLMMYRNLAQTAGFAALLGLAMRFSRVRLAPPSRARALVETGAVSLGVLALLAFGGPAVMAGAQAVPLIGVLLAPLQIFAGFGFTYMMYAQLKKMRAERSSGDSSSAMMWAFLGTKTIWVWSFATMLGLAAAPARRTLAVGAGFAALSWLLSRAALARLLRAGWDFLPERVAFRRLSVSRAALGDAAAFAALAALALALSLAGWAAFTFLLGVPAASASAFAMYAIYTVQNLVSCVATLETLRLQKRYGARPAPGRGAD